MDGNNSISTSGGSAPGSLDIYGIRIPGAVGCDMMGVNCAGFNTVTFQTEFENALKAQAIGGPAANAIGLTQTDVNDSDSNHYVSLTVKSKVQPFGSLRLWDTRDLKKPKLVSTFNVFCSTIDGVASADCKPPLGSYPILSQIRMENGKRMLYVVFARSGLVALDITDLKNPIEVARYQRTSAAWDTLNGRNGYLGDFAPSIPIMIEDVVIDPSNQCIYAIEKYGIYALERRSNTNPSVSACSGQPFGSISDELNR